MHRHTTYRQIQIPTLDSKKKGKKTQTNRKSKRKRTTNTNTQQIRYKNNVNSNIKTEINATNTRQTHTQGKCKRTARHTHFRQAGGSFSEKEPPASSGRPIFERVPKFFETETRKTVRLKHGLGPTDQPEPTRLQQFPSVTEIE